MFLNGSQCKHAAILFVKASPQVLEWKAPEVGREQFVAVAKELTMVTDAAGRPRPAIMYLPRTSCLNSTIKYRVFFGKSDDSSC